MTDNIRYTGQPRPDLLEVVTTHTGELSDLVPRDVCRAVEVAAGEASRAQMVGARFGEYSYGYGQESAFTTVSRVLFPAEGDEAPHVDNPEFCQAAAILGAQILATYGDSLPPHFQVQPSPESGV